MTVSSDIKVMHIITGLGLGGAEMMLYRLLTQWNPDEIESEVVTLAGGKPLGDSIRSIGIHVTELGFHPGIPDPRMIPRLMKVIRNYSPHLIQTWLYHADLIGGLAGRLCGSIPIVWGVRYTIGGRESLKVTTKAVVHLNALLSRWIPERIVCCAESAKISHIHHGYSVRKMVVIPNGFDTVSFRPDERARRDVRNMLGLNEKTPLVGLCGRFHRDKDHRTFLRAAGIIHRTLPDVHFVLWGKDIDNRNETLVTWIREENLNDCVHLLGPRTDSNKLFPALDIFVLSSSSEGFPNVIGEAMACGVPCVATDVGDTQQLVGKTGIVVPAADSLALATGILDLLGNPTKRLDLGKQARQRIIEEFRIEKIASSYTEMYRDIINRGRR